MVNWGVSSCVPVQILKNQPYIHFGEIGSALIFQKRIRTRCFEWGPLPPGSWLGNLVNRKPPLGGGVSCNQIVRSYQCADSLTRVCVYIYIWVWKFWKVSTVVTLCGHFESVLTCEMILRRRLSHTCVCICIYGCENPQKSALWSLCMVTLEVRWFVRRYRDVDSLVRVCVYIYDYEDSLKSAL